MKRAGLIDLTPVHHILNNVELEELLVQVTADVRPSYWRQEMTFTDDGLILKHKT